MNKFGDRAKMIAAMCIYGSIGVFVRNIALSRAAISLFRGVCGGLFLLLFLRLSGRKFDFAALRGKWLPLCISGAVMGVNWVLLFIAYGYAGVGSATLCYYTAPMIVLLASPLVLHEKLTLRGILCIAAALLGTAFVSQIRFTGSSFIGILLALAAAVLYATVVFINKKLADLPAYERAAVQLFSSALPLIPYLLLTQTADAFSTDARSLILLLILGIVHTGLAYTLFFDAVAKLPTKAVATYAYLDPLLAVVLSVLLLGEPFTLFTALGALLILGAAWWSERGTE